MFVLSLTSGKIKKGLLGFSVICVAAVIILVVLFQCGKNTPQENALSVNNNASSIEELLVFISSFGWEVNPAPDEVREIIIPAEFDDVYKKYNEIQLSQGYDLTEYAGERAKSWTFSVVNYPGFENEEYIKINVLTHSGKVIGGDVCSVKLDGFMHGFVKE